jgi:gliding motility-associated-like protein
MFRRLLPLLLVLTHTTVALGQSTLNFIENRGQWPEAVTFRAEVDGAVLWCERGSFLIDRYDASAMANWHAGNVAAFDPNASRVVKHHALRLKFSGATGPVRSEGIGVQQGAYNYFIGNDKSTWASNAHAFSAVVQEDLYPGVDLRFRRGGEVLKYDLIVAAGSDPGVVHFTYEGAGKMELRNGILVVKTSLGDMQEAVPLAYQMRDGREVPVECRYSLKGNEVGFNLGAYDPALELVIDPVLSFASYSGSTTDNFGYSATFDQQGFLYSGSSAFGQGYPTTTGAYDVTWNGGVGGGTTGTDIALSKWDTTGHFLIWSTFLGGSGDDLPHSLIVNDANELIVLGTTGSANFPTTTGALQSAFGGGTAFSPQGIGTTYPNGTDMIVSRLSASGAQLLASTYVGGSANDGINSAVALKYNYADEMRGEVEVTATGNILVASCTQSTNFPVTAGAYQMAIGGGTHDAVLFEFDPSLSTLVWSTYFGGSGADAAYSLEQDSGGNIFIAGGTTSLDLPVTLGTIGQSNNGGQADAFVASFSPNGGSLLSSTYYGSAAYDQFYFVDFDDADNVYVFGQTAAPTGELISNAAYSVSTGGQLLAKFNHGLTSVLWSSRIGATSGPGVGIPNISPTAFLVDYCDKIYISGWGSNIYIALTTTGLPVTPDAFQSTTDGQDFYLAVFDIDMSALSYATYFGGAESDEHVDGGTSRFDRRGRVYGAVCAGCGSHDDFPTTPGAWSSTNNSFNCNLGVFKFDFEAPLVIAGLAANDPLCAGGPVTFSNNSNLGTTYAWNFGDGNTSTETTPTHTYAAPGTYTVTLVASSTTACNTADSASIQITVLNAAPPLLVMPDTVLCGPSASLLLSATAGGQATQWTWSTTPGFGDMLNASTADSTALLQPVNAGTYYVRATAPGACAATGSVNISAALVDAAISPDIAICVDDNATISLSNIDAGSTIAWSPAGLIDAGQGTAQVQVSPSEATFFVAAVTSASGCFWTDSALVQVGLISGAAVTASVDQSVVLAGTTVQLEATPGTGVTYQWQPASAVSNPLIAAPTAIINASTVFYVTVSDGICSSMDSVFVKVHELLCDDPDIFVPDAFTPNGDGSNDVLFVRGLNIASLDFQVFDRWGETVFRTTDQKQGWDGAYKGKPVDPAVFVYWLKVGCKDGQDFFTKGNVSVIR